MSLSWLNPRCLGWSPNPSSSGSFLPLLRPSPTTPFQHWSSVTPDPSLWHAVRCGSPPTPSPEFSLSVLSTQLWKPSPKPSALPYPWCAPTPRMTNCHRMTECIKPGRGRCKCLTSADWQLLSNRALCLIHTFPKPKNRIWPKAGEWPYACREPDLTALKLKNHTYSDFPTIINMLCKPECLPWYHSLSIQVQFHLCILRCKAGSCCHGSEFLLHNKVNSRATDLLPPHHRQISYLAFWKSVWIV